MNKISCFLSFALIFSSSLSFASQATEKQVDENKIDKRSIVRVDESSNNPQQIAFFDNEFAWDEFDHRGSTIWACRGVQTGKFVSRELCNGRPKVDSHWPDKSVPGFWKGE